jgi:hypothetical protein
MSLNIKKIQPKPIIMRAIKWEGETVSQMPNWMEQRLQRDKQDYGRSFNLTVQTAYGEDNAQEGDWIVEDQDGSLFVVSGTEFDKMFSVVED